MQRAETNGFTPGVLFAERYRIVRFITRGGMGALYEVEDERTKRNLALKVLPSDVFRDDPEWAARFKNECEAIGKVRSEYVVPVLDNGSIDEASFIVTELIDGEDLESVIEKHPGGLPRAQVATYLGQVSAGLQKLHEAGIIHRDLKPGNLMLTRRDDGGPWIRIIDFGIVKVVRPGEQVEPTEGGLGSLAYMAPEARRKGRITHLTDIYSLGVIAHKLLLGRHYDPSTGIDEAFLAWYHKATAERPEDRFESAIEAVRELSAALEGTGTAKPSTPTTQYPDLHGTWKGTLVSDWVDPSTGRTLDPLDVFMVVRQTGKELNMRLLTRESQSVSRVSGIVDESDGQWFVDGTYRNEPKMLVRNRSPIHNGAIKLQIGGPPPTSMSGHYWTDRGTKGEMMLRLISRQTVNDYAAASALVIHTDGAPDG